MGGFSWLPKVGIGHSGLARKNELGIEYSGTVIFLLKAPADWSNAVIGPFCVVVRSYQIPKHAILKEVAKALLTVDVSEAATSDEDKEVINACCIEQTHIGVSKIFHRFKVYIAQTSALCRSCGIVTGSLKPRIIYQY